MDKFVFFPKGSDKSKQIVAWWNGYHGYTTGHIAKNKNGAWEYTPVKDMSYVIPVELHIMHIANLKVSLKDILYEAGEMNV